VDRVSKPDGSIGHAALRIRDSMIMMGQSSDQYPPMPAGILVYVEDVDEVYRKALQLGAETSMEVADQFYGDRMAGVLDFAGNTWWIATHIEDVPDEEVQRRANQRASG
jgi:PhnB protein